MKVQVSWVKSVSTDIVSQELVFSVDNTGGTLALDADVENHLFENVEEGNLITVSLRAFNGSKFSLPLSGEFTIPVVPVPEAPSNLKFEIVTD